MIVTISRKSRVMQYATGGTRDAAAHRNKKCASFFRLSYNSAECHLNWIASGTWQKLLFFQISSQFLKTRINFALTWLQPVSYTTASSAKRVLFCFLFSVGLRHCASAALRFFVVWVLNFYLQKKLTWKRRQRQCH